MTRSWTAPNKAPGRKVKTWARSTSFRVLSGLICVLSLLTVNAQDLSLTESEQAWIEEHPVIRVHSETDWPPFNFVDGDKPAGFSIEYMNLVAEAAGLEVEYVTGPGWDDFLGMMRSGDLDVMLNIVQTDDRNDFLLFTEPYTIMSPVLAGQESVAEISSLNELNGKTLCLARGTSEFDYVARVHPQIDLLALDGTLSCLHAVVDGQAFATLDGYSVLRHLLDNNFVPGIRLANVAIDPNMASVMRLATSTSQPALRSILQKAMQTLDESVVAELRRKWRSSEPATSTRDQLATLTAEELQWIAEHPVIRVHNEMDWPPFNFNEDGEPKGFSVDFVNIVTASVGLQVEYVSGPTWQQFMDMIRNGELDVIANAAITDDRRT